MWHFFLHKHLVSAHQTHSLDVDLGYQSVSTRIFVTPLRAIKGTPSRRDVTVSEAVTVLQDSHGNQADFALQQKTHCQPKLWLLDLKV